MNATLKYLDLMNDLVKRTKVDLAESNSNGDNNNECEEMRLKQRFIAKDCIPRSRREFVALDTSHFRTVKLMDYR
ncbi:hypothetical protein RCL_jg9598.t1 [Rhizophagus clarus]|uniref:Uncharacterized protein n=1 Tax=Rhizophagus clarus TaxID=94130 RepID=A0A8H3M226_9GLOM|nr:hypothetical protein RCL_jg9598.t1 [Rhizophagus clarus]